MLLMIDNYDSFTYNLVQYLGELGETIEVFRNDRITIEEIEEKQPERIVISPGPCTPLEAGVSIEVDKALCRKNPDTGGLPRPSVNRRCLRRRHNKGASPHAWQDFPYPS